MKKSPFFMGTALVILLALCISLLAQPPLSAKAGPEPYLTGTVVIDGTETLVGTRRL